MNVYLINPPQTPKPQQVKAVRDARVILDPTDPDSNRLGGALAAIAAGARVGYCYLGPDDEDGFTGDAVISDLLTVDLVALSFSDEAAAAAHVAQDREEEPPPSEDVETFGDVEVTLESLRTALVLMTVTGGNPMTASVCSQMLGRAHDEEHQKQVRKALAEVFPWMLVGGDDESGE